MLLILFFFLPFSITRVKMNGTEIALHRETEVNVLAGSILLFILCSLYAIVRTIHPKEKLVYYGGYYQQPFKQPSYYYRNLSVGGAVLAIMGIVAAFATAGVTGRFQPFFRMVGPYPDILGKLAWENKSYMQVCPFGYCAVYCCKNEKNQEWKDCSEDCDSPLGVRDDGTASSSSCFFRTNLETFCKHDEKPQRALGSVGSSLCNKNPEIGAITCTCCVSTKGQSFWDCQASCGSHPEDAGVPTSYSQCLGDGIATDHNYFQFFCSSKQTIDRSESVDDSLEDTKSNRSVYSQR